jgi:Spy/CpxP family protein refolding chaperone
MSSISALIISLLIFTPALSAQDSYVDFEKGLNLTESQRVKVEDVKKRYLNEWRSSGREAMQKNLELKELSKNPSPNRERIEKLQNELSAIRASRDNTYNQYKGEVSRVLSEQQREKYHSFTNSERRRNVHPLGLRGHGR